MAFNQKEQEIIKYGLQNGKSQEEVRQALSNFRLGITPKLEPTTPEPSFLKDLGGDIKETGQGIVGSIKQRGEDFANTDTLFGKTKALTGAVQDVAGEAFIGAGKAVLPQRAEEAISSGFGKVAGAVAGTELAQDAIGTISRLREENPQVAEAIDALANAGLLAVDLATLGAGSRLAKQGIKTGTRVAGEVATGALEGTVQAVEEGTKLASQLSKKLKPTLAPTNSLEEAIGQISRAKPKELPAVKKALTSIDTQGVKTFEDLSKTISDNIPELAQAVDSELLKDTGTYTLKQLAVKEASKSGKKITTDYISDALNNLDELYGKIGEGVKKADIEDLIKKAKNEGLTRKEVNDISRTYGQEFGSKAFSKLGDPLTSVNAQKFETIRKGLKEVARGGLGGDAAKLLDNKLSSLYTTQRLIAKQAEKVNALKQVIQKRGLLEKIGVNAVKALDLVSGGTIRGVAGGLLPRGVGNKVMNALDLEDALRKNLDIIEQALRAKTPQKIESALNKLNN